MNFYVLQVKTRYEERYLKAARETIPEEEARFWWFRRELRIRKAGVWREIIASVFPGYLFMQAAGVTDGLFNRLRRLPNFQRFLKSNQEITPLGERDIGLIRHFIGSGELVKKSLVTFTPEDRVHVVSGPLKGLEGLIAKVDKRKQRIKVKIRLYENAFLIDFCYDSVERINVPDGGS